jgi:hypothetical protein
MVAPLEQVFHESSNFVLMMSIEGGSSREVLRLAHVHIRNLLISSLGIDYTIGCLPSLDDPLRVIAGKGAYVFLICHSLMAARRNNCQD